MLFSTAYTQCVFVLVSAIQCLLEKGADVLVTNDEGQTPGDRATQAGHTEIAKKLETHVVFCVSELVN